MPSAEASGLATSPAPPTTAPVYEYTCLFTHDLKKKQKKWQDGRIKYHTFNRKLVTYDQSGTRVGEMHWLSEYDLEEGEEVTLERGSAIVQVSELVATHQQDLSELVDKRVQAKQQRQLTAPPRRMPVPGSAPGPRPFPVVRPQPSANSQVRHRPLLSVIGTPTGHHGRALVPNESPFEQRQMQEDSGDRPAKRPRYDTTPPSKMGYAQSLFGARLYLSSQPASSLPQRTQVQSQPRVAVQEQRNDSREDEVEQQSSPHFDRRPAAPSRRNDLPLTSRSVNRGLSAVPAQKLHERARAREPVLKTRMEAERPEPAERIDRQPETYSMPKSKASERHQRSKPRDEPLRSTTVTQEVEEPELDHPIQDDVIEIGSSPPAPRRESRAMTEFESTIVEEERPKPRQKEKASQKKRPKDTAKPLEKEKVPTKKKSKDAAKVTAARVSKSKTSKEMPVEEDDAAEGPVEDREGPVTILQMQPRKKRGLLMASKTLAIASPQPEKRAAARPVKTPELRLAVEEEDDPFASSPPQAEELDNDPFAPSLPQVEDDDVDFIEADQPGRSKVSRRQPKQAAKTTKDPRPQLENLSGDPFASTLPPVEGDDNDEFVEPVMPVQSKISRRQPKQASKATEDSLRKLKQSGSDLLLTADYEDDDFDAPVFANRPGPATQLPKQVPQPRKESQPQKPLDESSDHMSTHEDATASHVIVLSSPNVVVDDTKSSSDEEPVLAARKRPRKKVLSNIEESSDGMEPSASRGTKSKKRSTRQKTVVQEEESGEEVAVSNKSRKRRQKDIAPEEGSEQEMSAPLNSRKRQQKETVEEEESVDEMPTVISAPSRTATRASKTKKAPSKLRLNKIKSSVKSREVIGFRYDQPDGNNALMRAYGLMSSSPAQPSGEQRPGQITIVSEAAEKRNAFFAPRAGSNKSSLGSSKRDEQREPSPAPNNHESTGAPNDGPETSTASKAVMPPVLSGHSTTAKSPLKSPQKSPQKPDLPSSFIPNLEDLMSSSDENIAGDVIDAETPQVAHVVVPPVPTLDRGQNHQSVPKPTTAEKAVSTGANAFITQQEKSRPAEVQSLQRPLHNDDRNDLKGPQAPSLNCEMVNSQKNIAPLRPDPKSTGHQEPATKAVPSLAVEPFHANERIVDAASKPAQQHEPVSVTTPSIDREPSLPGKDTASHKSAPKTAQDELPPAIPLQPQRQLSRGEASFNGQPRPAPTLARACSNLSDTSSRPAQTLSRAPSNMSNQNQQPRQAPVLTRAPSNLSDQTCQPRPGSVLTRASSHNSDQVRQPPRIVNPATRGRKAANKSHAAGKMPETIIPAAVAPIPAPVLGGPAKPAAPTEAPAPKRGMTFPGFATLGSAGPWSREAHDLLGMVRPGSEMV